MGLAQQLREASWPLHKQAEQAGIMPDMLRGRLPLAGFCALQRNLHALYQALEPALAARAAEPWLAPLPLHTLRRAAPLAQDLAALHGPHWATELPLAAPAQAYVQHLHTLAASAPLHLLAHAWVRYGGDLAGGQLLRQRAQQAYGLVGERGTRFHDFGPPAQVAALATALRHTLDALPLDEAQAQALVAEAQWAFARHVQLFEALQQALPLTPAGPLSG